MTNCIIVDIVNYLMLLLANSYNSFLPPHASEQGNVIRSVSIYIYIFYYTSKSGIWLVISRVASYFHEPKASANTAYE